MSANNPILARDLGDGPHRAFGSALRRRAEPLRFITERPIRPRSCGNCPTCGDKFFECPCEEEIQ